MESPPRLLLSEVSITPLPFPLPFIAIIEATLGSTAVVIWIISIPSLPLPRLVHPLHHFVDCHTNGHHQDAEDDDQIRPLVALDLLSLWLCAHQS